jgi:nucleoside-diphosphate-sugar epimerase
VAPIFILVAAGGPDTMNNKFWAAVHVHDVADALLLVYETPESSGRYICSLEQMDIKDMVNLLKSRYPNYDYVDK